MSADQHGAREDRPRAERAGRPDLVGTDRRLRAPFRAEQELGNRHQPEETERLEEQRKHDADGGEDGDRGADKQQAAHDLFHHAPRPQLRADQAEPDTGAEPAIWRSKARKSPAARGRSGKRNARRHPPVWIARQSADGYRVANIVVDQAGLRFGQRPQFVGQSGDDKRLDQAGWSASQSAATATAGRNPHSATYQP